MTRRELYALIGRKRTEYGLTAADVPVDPFALAARHGNTLSVEYAPFSNRGLGGMLCKGAVSLIVLNARHGPEERRFELAHELVHYWFDEEAPALHIDSLRRPSGQAYREWRANEGAAELLVPCAVFVPLAAGQALDAHKGHPGALIHDAPWMTAVAALFGVTEAVIRRRLCGLRSEIASLL